MMWSNTEFAVFAFVINNCFISYCGIHKGWGIVTMMNVSSLLTVYKRAVCLNIPPERGDLCYIIDLPHICNRSSKDTIVYFDWESVCTLISLITCRKFLLCTLTTINYIMDSFQMIS